MVMGRSYCGSSGTYLRTSSSSLSLPSSASRTVAAAVNCFEMDPASKIVEGLFGMSYSRSASPKAPVYRGWPARSMPTAHPGPVVESQRAKTFLLSGVRSRAAD